ncbi:MAG: hypothetical protein ACAI44_22120 [Candidatus Sericytochromatia bacterium]
MRETQPENPLPAQLVPYLAACRAELGQPAETAWGPDPYWPKWDNQWWRLTLLLELGEPLPEALAEAFATRLEQHYLHHFPLIESELPAGCDPYGQILCHCALGTAARILLAGGIDVWARLPWLYDWLFRYQQADGGYNCDEQAYTGSHKSSLVSTLPVLEALLASRLQADFTAAERDLLGRGVDYLLAHHLYQRRGGGIIEAAWLQPLFPRFYEYDILRGLSLVIRASLALRRPLAWPALAEAFQQLEDQLEAGRLQPQAWYLGEQKTLRPGPEGWIRSQPVSLFPLLEQAIRPEIGREYITREWNILCRRLDELNTLGLLEGR